MSTFIPKVKIGQILDMTLYNRDMKMANASFVPYGSYFLVTNIHNSSSYGSNNIVYAVTICTKTGKKFKSSSSYTSSYIDKFIETGTIKIIDATSTGKTGGRLLASEAEIGKAYLIKRYFNSKRIIYVPVIITGFGERRAIATDLLGIPTTGPFLHEEIRTNVKSWLDAEVKKTQAEIDIKTSYLVSLNSFYDNIQ